MLAGIIATPLVILFISLLYYTFKFLSNSIAFYQTTPLNYSIPKVPSTAWKVSVFGIFLVRISPLSNWIRTRETRNSDTFYTVLIFGGEQKNYKNLSFLHYHKRAFSAYSKYLLRHTYLKMCLMETFHKAWDLREIFWYVSKRGVGV